MFSDLRKSDGEGKQYMRRVLLVIAVALAMVLPTCAMASTGHFGTYLATITAESNGQTATYNIDWSNYFSSDSFSSPIQWKCNDIISLYGGNGTLLGEVTGLFIRMTPGTFLGMDITALAGNAATKFSITSGFFFDAMTNPEGYATAGLTITDTNKNGASLTGLSDGGNAFFIDPGEANATSIVTGPITAAARKTSTGNGDCEGILDGTVDHVFATYNFELSAKDSVSGTSYAELTPTPEPGSFLLLLAGAAGIAGAAIRRKRA